jgi:hypothetical protein
MDRAPGADILPAEPEPLDLSVRELKMRKPEGARAQNGCRSRGEVSPDMRVRICLERRLRDVRLGLIRGVSPSD